MSDKKPSNPDVFPIGAKSGLTLRDLLAGLAMVGLLSDPKCPVDATKREIADDAYGMADAMLKAREEA